MSAPLCPKCGSAAVASKTRYGVRFECCGLWAWGEHPLASAETHAARKVAHAAFDKLWSGDGAKLSRGAAYRHLQIELGLAPADCHMKTMDYSTASRVPAAVSRIIEKHSLPETDFNGP